MKIYQSPQNPAAVAAAAATSDKTSNLQKALDKHTHLLQDLQQKPNLTSNPATYVVSGGAGGGAAAGKTATILVSKSKTKTGLPLLLKNSINN